MLKTISSTKTSAFDVKLKLTTFKEAEICIYRVKDKMDAINYVDTLSLIWLQALAGKLLGAWNFLFWVTPGAWAATIEVVTEPALVEYTQNEIA